MTCTFLASRWSNARFYGGESWKWRRRSRFGKKWRFDTTCWKTAMQKEFDVKGHGSFFPFLWKVFDETPHSVPNGGKKSRCPFSTLKSKQMNCRSWKCRSLRARICFCFVLFLKSYSNNIYREARERAQNYRVWLFLLMDFSSLCVTSNHTAM